MELIIGVMKVNDKVDITDPCYDKKTWCRMNSVEILPGEYECFADVWNTTGWGKRVACIGIRLLHSEETVFEQIGEIGVDSGLAGFYQDKPDFTDDEWSEFCNIVDEHPTIHLHEGEFGGRLNGFTASSGYGDGGYPVYATRNSAGQVVALEIDFL